jgi:hypothetical protein
MGEAHHGFEPFVAVVGNHCSLKLDPDAAKISGLRASYRR